MWNHCGLTTGIITKAKFVGRAYWLKYQIRGGINLKFDTWVTGMGETLPWLVTKRVCKQLKSNCKENPNQNTKKYHLGNNTLDGERESLQGWDNENTWGQHCPTGLTFLPHSKIRRKRNCGIQREGLKGLYKKVFFTTALFKSFLFFFIYLYEELNRKKLKWEVCALCRLRKGSGEGWGRPTSLHSTAVKFNN